ncbi:MAG: hypothetical protein R3F61_05665 [Myxococcota bacterium]
MWWALEEPEVLHDPTPEAETVRACLAEASAGMNAPALEGAIERILAKCAPAPVPGLGSLEVDGLYFGDFCGTTHIQHHAFYVNGAEGRAFAWRGMRGRECDPE